jgi:pimeloyl-ACP methyl ester carboxylesterase
VQHVETLAKDQAVVDLTGAPDLPIGRRIELPGRGRTFVREVEGPPGAPTLVLLHGLMASGGLNWFQAFGLLSRRFRVIAPDLRGHGRGIRAWKRFRLADCADDVAATLDALEIDRAIVAGYSMGGPVAQLLWHRHPDRVAGLVMCATSNRFVPGVRERMFVVTAMSTLAGSTRVGQLATRIPVEAWQRQIPTAVRARPDSLTRWAAAEMRRHDPRMLTEALAATTNFNSAGWLHDIDVPTAIMVTRNDRAIPAQEQLRLLLAVPGASVRQYDEGHTWCAKSNFGPALASVCDEVADRVAS